jgi:hypothetical protein
MAGVKQDVRYQQDTISGRRNFDVYSLMCGVFVDH